MAKKTQAAMVSDIHVSLFGVEGSADRGVVGDVKSIDKQLKILNGSVKTNTAWRKALVWTMGFIFLSIIALSSAVVALSNAAS